MKELLNKIGITQAGHFDDKGRYIVEFESDKEYNKAFSKLDKTDLVEEDEEGNIVNTEASIIAYESENFRLVLVAKFDEDKYELQITEMKDTEMKG